RGAPLIGVTAAYGIALAMNDDPGEANLEAACAQLAASRPTAVNLQWAIARTRARLSDLQSAQRAELAWREAANMADEDIACNRAIGRHGLELVAALHRQLGRPVNLLTHCNAGWLATVDWGTALAPVYCANAAGIPVHVWVSETRPRNQGLLTAWELREEGIAHTVIADNAAGHLLQRGRVDLVVVGADRVSADGDVCNKIGTWLKALAAKEAGVPFYAAVPSSTMDWTITDALREIPIEERGGEEVRVLHGQHADGGVGAMRLLPVSADVANPAFDVTPAHLVSGIITERGIAAAEANALSALLR
ncbi:MAG: S-methyl-5-thioribose-1-phosphate isomerase, partial [Casimicrobiaceae bacterium]